MVDSKGKKLERFCFRNSNSIPYT